MMSSTVMLLSHSPLPGCFDFLTGELVKYPQLLEKVIKNVVCLMRWLQLMDLVTSMQNRWELLFTSVPMSLFLCCIFSPAKKYFDVLI